MELGELHVLVVDDDEEMRGLLTRLLVLKGHQVLAAESAEAGLELLPYHTFHLAFLDQNLPGMEGLVLGEYLQRNNPHMKVALVTGEDDERLGRLAHDKGIPLIPKPFEPAQIFDLITQYQEEAAERREARLNREDPDFDPPIRRHLRGLAPAFGLPSVPRRIEERLVEVVKRSLAELKPVTRYNERDRVIALAGLLAMGVLGVKPPKAHSGRTLYQEYDDLMREHGRRVEFEEDGD